MHTEELIFKIAAHIYYLVNKYLPKSSTLPVFVLHWSSSSALSNAGNTNFTPWADNFDITALAQSSEASRT